MQMEALTGWAAKDEWDFEHLGISNEPFVKANYPHHGKNHRLSANVLMNRRNSFFRSIFNSPHSKYFIYLFSLFSSLVTYVEGIWGWEGEISLPFFPHTGLQSHS